MNPGPVDRGRPVRVSAVRPVSDGVVEVLLAAADGGRLPRWTPGAHVDLVLPTGLARPYSLAGDPADDRVWRLLVGRSADPDGASAHVHGLLHAGDLVHVRGPRSLFALGGGSRFLFLGSGTGIAPLLPMARWVRAARVHPWALVHLDRSTRQRALRAEVEGMGAEARSVPDRSGVLTALHSASPGTAVYACGSSRFVDAVAEAAPPHVALHRQRFDAPAGADGVDRPYELVLAKRGERVRVEQGTSLLDALHQAGAEIPVSCGAGICGACIVRVVEGSVHHRDSILTDSQRTSSQQIVTCVSTAAGGRLVLDV